MIRSASAQLLLSLVLAPAALAGGPSVIEVKHGKTFTVKYDLGFKLTCPHFVVLTIDDESVVQAIDFPAVDETTKKTSFNFTADSVGSTDVTVMWTGEGGDCGGSTNEIVTVNVVPDPKYLDKAFKAEAKAVGKTFKSKMKSALKFACGEIDAIVDDVEAEVLEPAAAAGQIATGTGFVALGAAFQLRACLQELALIASELAESGDVSALPALMQTGSDGSLWSAAEEDAHEAYAGLIEDLEKKVQDALGDIEKLAVSTFKANAYFSYDVPYAPTSGPTLATDPVDDGVKPAGIVAGVAFTDSVAGSGIVGVGWADDSQDNVAVRVVGPPAVGSTTLIPVDDMTKGLGGNFEYSFTAGFAEGNNIIPGHWRLEARHEDDALPGAVIFITVPELPIL